MGIQFQPRNLFSLLSSSSGRLLAMFVVIPVFFFVSVFLSADTASAAAVANWNCKQSGVKFVCYGFESDGKPGSNCSAYQANLGGYVCDTSYSKTVNSPTPETKANLEAGATACNPFTTILEFVGRTLLQITSFLAAMTGKLLDASIQFSLTIGKPDVMGSVKAGWTVFRDFANMFFIFVLLYIAFATMLQIANFDTKRTLAKLIVVGLLLNFSLFFAQIVVDVSNVLAYTLYKNVADNSAQGWKTSSLSQPFMTQFGFTGIYDAGKSGIDFTNKKNVQNQWVVMLMGGIFIFIVAFVFLIAAAVFLIRSIKLLFLMVAAPLAFIAYILPGTEQYAKKWWHMLLGESFVAPLFLLFIYITLQMSSAFAGIRGKLDSGMAKELSDPVNNGVSIIFQFLLLSGLMIASVIFAKSLSESTAKMSMGLAQK